MSDSDNESDVTLELRKFLSEPMTRVEVINLIQPMRAAVVPLLKGVTASLLSIAKESSEPEHRERAKKAFNELDEIFEQLELFDARISRTVQGKMTWQDDSENSEDATHE